MCIMAKQGRIARGETGTLMALSAHQANRVFHTLDLSSSRKYSHVSMIDYICFLVCLYSPSWYASEYL